MSHPTHVWIFNENRRVYTEDNKSSPIWREHWVKREITGETPKSWIISEGWAIRKIPKNPKTPLRDVAWSEEELDQRVWVHENKYKLIRLIDCLPAEQLIDIACRINYKPAPPSTP